MCARRSSQQARSGASSLRFRRRLIEATRGSGAGRRGPPRGMGGRAFERRARIAWRRADFGAARSAPAGLAAAPGPPLWTVCPSGLRGWTQVPLAQAAWVQIPQLSCRRGSPRPLPPRRRIGAFRVRGQRRATPAGEAGGGVRGRGGRAPPAPASAESLLRGWASKASAPPSAGDISVALAQTPAAIVRPGRPPGGRSAALVVERESRQGVAGGGHRPVGLMDKASASGAGDSRFESWAGQDFRGGRFRSLPGAGGDWRGLAGGARRPAPAPGAKASASLSRSPRLAAPRQRRPWSIQARRLSQDRGK